MKRLRLRLTFPEHLVTQPVLGRLTREFDVLPNIRRAHVEESSGWVVCELAGEDVDVDAAEDWLTNLGVQVDRLVEPFDG